MGNLKYAAFDTLNGEHPWQKSVPESCVFYKVRNLPHGKIIYFNFLLAKEMGLIKNEHPHEMNKELEEKILSTFNIQIINDFDLLKGNFETQTQKEKPYMATRYLQLQHLSKTGKTSGDGRSIWNGCIEHNGKSWDINSRGTGVTSLAPGYVVAGKPIPTGCTSYGYSCGQADLDELIGSALMSETFHRQGLKTERTLAIIRTSQNQGIGVRASTNLIRPAHLFLHLKQSNLDALTRSADYLIERQTKNKEWDIPITSKEKYDLMLQNIGRDFAKFAATLDADYIFVWLEWDGDNVLANAGIIDYGSVRQFGVRHDQYRFDDIERFSTNLNEQKRKAQYIVQTFAQAVNYIKTGAKKPIEEFKSHPVVKEFDLLFERYRLEHLLTHVGYSETQAEKLNQYQNDAVKSLDKSYRYFERKKVSKDVTRVPDGINRPALFNMRKLTLSLFQKLTSSEQISDVALDSILSNSFSIFAPHRDKKITLEMRTQFRHLINNFLDLCNSIRGRRKLNRFISDLSPRAQSENRLDRMTGNGVEHVVEIILEQIRKNASSKLIQKSIEGFIASQPSKQDAHTSSIRLRGSSKTVLKTMQAVLLDCKDEL